jgi:hypothetical protein
MLLANNRGYCPWCKQGTAFDLMDSINFASPDFRDRYRNGPVSEGRPRTGVLVYQCLHCGDSIVLLEHELPSVPDDLPDGRTWREMVAPAQSPKSLPAAAPEGVRSLYEEASKCEAAGALRGAGVLYRAAVEELVKQQGGTGRDLNAKIESRRGTWPEELVDDLHEARMLGNDSIHAGITYSADEVEDVAGLIEEAVLLLYVQPEQKRAMKERRQVRRDAAKAKQS